MNEQPETINTLPYFSFVIPAYNEEEHIGSCLQSIFNSNLDSTKYEVIVVENGSHDRTYNIAFSFERARVFKLPQGNVGAVRNYGAAQARGHILIFIDADCLIDGDWLNRAENLINSFPNCAYGGGVKLPGHATWIETFWLLQNGYQPTLPKNLIGASTMLPIDLFFKIDGFNELVTSGEDTDLHNRLVTKNTPVFINHSLNVTHLGNAKTLFQFIQRQIWHSENYLNNIKNSVKDPVFIITFIFISLLVTLIIQAFFYPENTKYIITLAFLTLLPALLSCKRMIRSGYFTIKPKYLLKIYILDLLYLIGRSIGILKESFQKLKMKKFIRNTLGT